MGLGLNYYNTMEQQYNVYIVRKKTTGKVVYVGKTNNLERRIKQHGYRSKWVKEIGPGNLLFKVIKSFDNNTDAVKYEEKLINKYNTIRNGYNKYHSGKVWAEHKDTYRKHYRYANWDKEKERDRARHLKDRCSRYDNEIAELGIILKPVKRRNNYKKSA